MYKVFRLSSTKIEMVVEYFPQHYILKIYQGFWINFSIRSRAKKL